MKKLSAKELPTQTKRYRNLKYHGLSLKVVYAYDAEVDRWFIRENNFPIILGLEADSISELEAQLPEILSELDE